MDETSKTTATVTNLFNYPIMVFLTIATTFVFDLKHENVRLKFVQSLIGKVTVFYLKKLGKQWNVTVPRPGIILMKMFQNLPLSDNVKIATSIRL